MFSLFLLPAPLPGQTQNPSTEPPKPEPVKTSITVVDKIATETPANVTVMDATSLEKSPGTNLDDRLRDVPGFSLFRRSSSLVANPTTQGISLRGIGSSGASRTLVLWDSIPANDPFGGWVYWTGFVPDDIERVEISRGAATSVFGDRAMSGAIGIFSRPAEKLHVLGEYETGNQRTHDLSAGFSDLWGREAVSGSARAFTSDGYYIVPANIRGRADTQANVRFVTGGVRLDHYTSIGDFFFKTSVLAEERQNGTAVTHNSRGWGPSPCTTYASSAAIRSPCWGIIRGKAFRDFRQRNEQSEYRHAQLQPDRPERCGRRRGNLAASPEKVECHGRGGCRPRGRHEHGPPGAERPPGGRRHSVAVWRVRAGRLHTRTGEVLHGIAGAFPGTASS
jgi:outer membrane receptor protein involved in Fe transport